MEVHPDDRENTAFSRSFGLFQYNVMSFGLATVSSTFMLLITIVFSGILFTTFLAYLDDIIVFGQNYIKMLDRLDTALGHLKQANLKLKPSKWAFGPTSVNFLSHVISVKQESTDQEKLHRIKYWLRPHNQGKARSIFGNATYYRKFIKYFAHIVKPLNVSTNQRQCYWFAVCMSSFKTIEAAF